MAFSSVFVTGGAGFIGSHLIDRLLAQGTQVVTVDDFNDYYPPALKRSNVGEHINDAAYTLVEGDIRDLALVRSVVQQHRPQCIVHLAARAGVRPSLVDPFLYETTNVAGTLNLLEVARTGGVRRFVFGSSSSVYGVNSKVPFAESDPLLQPVSPYAATKIAGEALCNAYAHLYGLPIASLRFFTVYGPRQRPDLAIRKFAEKMLADQPIELFGDGSSSRDYTFVEDIVAGVMAAMNRDAPGHEVFNLGNSSPVTLAQLVAELEGALGKKAIIERRPDQPGDVPRTFADIEKSQRVLGYRPETPLSVGIGRFVEWLRAQPVRER